MKLLTFSAGNGPRLGALVDDQVVDLHETSEGSLPIDMRSFLKLGQAGLERVQSIVERSAAKGQTHALASVRIMAPILNPSKIIGIGMNYLDHCREQNVEPPSSPIIFAKFTTSIIGPDEAIRWDPALTQRVDFEVELAVVIGRVTRRVSQAEALDYVAGYTICNDVSARDLQKGEGKQWLRGKALDTFCPLGPYLVTRDDITDPHSLAIGCKVNGQVMQDSNTAEMIFNVPYLIEFLSHSFTLQPGDIIATGTPHGVGVFRTPPVFLKDGDEVTTEIEGIGQLTNVCVAETTV